MDRERFELLIARAVQALPKEFVVRLENITVVVEDQPTPRQLARARLKRGQTLLGLYDGVPLSEQHYYHSYNSKGANWPAFTNYMH